MRQGFAQAGKKKAALSIIKDSSKESGEEQHSVDVCNGLVEKRDKFIHTNVFSLQRKKPEMFASQAVFVFSGTGDTFGVKLPGSFET